MEGGTSAENWRVDGRGVSRHSHIRYGGGGGGSPKAQDVNRAWSC